MPPPFLPGAVPLRDQPSYATVNVPRNVEVAVLGKLQSGLLRRRIICSSSAVRDFISASLPRLSTFKRINGSVLDERRLKRQSSNSIG